MMRDDFIESVITPKAQSRKAMISRKFYGMETVARFDDELMEAHAVARNEQNGGDEEDE